MVRRALVVAGALGLGFSPACGGSGEIVSRRSVEVGLRGPTARQRIESALARGQRPTLPRVEMTAAPISEHPLERNPPPPSAIKIHDDYWPERLLEQAGANSALSLEDDRVGRAIGLACSALAAKRIEPDVVVADVTLSTPSASVLTRKTSSPALATCVEQQLVRFAATPFLRITVRVTARFVPPEGFDPGEAEEDLTIIDRLLAAETGPGRTKALLLHGGARAYALGQLPRARAAFERLLALGDKSEDPASRGAALDGLAAVLLLEDKSAEASAAARALVCPSRYAFLPNGKLPQDHSEDYWRAWDQIHPTAVGKTTPSKPSALVADGPRTWEEETRFRSPYENCQALDVPESLIATAWRRIGTVHLQRDPAAGPFRINRAAAALRHALGFTSSRDPARPFVALQLARAVLRQQRYREAAHILSAALVSHPPDDEVAVRLAQLVATALTHSDLDGPPETEPAVGAWPDLADTEINPGIVASKMTALVIDRVDDPELVAQSRRSQANVLRWLVWELLAVGQYGPAIPIADRFLARHTMHRDAPAVQWEQVLALTSQRQSAPPGSFARSGAQRVEDEARVRLSGYPKNAAWTAANAKDQEALDLAAELAKRR